MDIISFKSFIPEIFFSVSIIFQLLYNVKIVNNLHSNYPILSKEVYSQTLYILFCLICIYNELKLECCFSNFLITNDEGIKYTKIIVIIISLFIMPLIQESFKIQKINFFEFYSILLLALLSLLIMISSCDLMLFYILMEMQALCFYILASINRNSTFSVEAGLKYFVSGSFISGFYLLGCSLIYGSLGTLNLKSINLLLAFNINAFSCELNYIVLTGIILIVCTLLFKLACAPFHFWSPDVYDGAPISSTLIFSVLAKLPLFYFFMKLINSINDVFFNINDVLLTFGILSALVGTLFALNQKRLKRLIIYSSIAQTGFLVSGLSIGNIEGYTSVYFFLIIYLITSIMIWGHFVIFYSFSSRIENFYLNELSPLFLSSLSNLFKKNSLWCFSFIIIFFSIGGIPPLSGFLSKMFILYELLNYNKTMASILLIFISAISVYYYIRLIKVLFFESKHSGSSTGDSFKVVFFTKGLDCIYIIFVFLLFCLLILFYFPTLVLTVSQYIAIHSFGF